VTAIYFASQCEITICNLREMAAFVQHHPWCYTPSLNITSNKKHKGSTKWGQLQTKKVY